MLSLHNRASLLAAPSLPLDPTLSSVLTERIQSLQADDLLDLTHFLVVQEGDTEEAILGEVGFTPLINPIDGERYGSSGFHPWWDWLQRHAGWFELVVTVGDSGFAFVLFIEDAGTSDLVTLCREWAVS